MSEVDRTCGTCGGVASVQRITSRRMNGVPTGTSYEYLCAGCGKRFTTESTWSHVSALFGAACLAAGAWGFSVTARGDSFEQYVLPGLFAVSAALAAAYAIRRIVIARKNPVR